MAPDQSIFEGVVRPENVEQREQVEVEEHGDGGKENVVKPGAKPIKRLLDWTEHTSMSC